MYIVYLDDEIIHSPYPNAVKIASGRITQRQITHSFRFEVNRDTYAWNNFKPFLSTIRVFNANTSEKVFHGRAIHPEPFPSACHTDIQTPKSIHQPNRFCIFQNGCFDSCLSICYNNQKHARCDSALLVSAQSFELSVYRFHLPEYPYGSENAVLFHCCIWNKLFFSSIITHHNQKRI